MNGESADRSDYTLSRNPSHTSEDAFLRPYSASNGSSMNRLWSLVESTDTEVPETFQAAWAQLLTRRNGNIGVLDGFKFVTDILMQEEGFHVVQMEDSESSEKETQSIRRSYYTHLANPADPAGYSCVLLFSKNSSKTIIQSVVSSPFKNTLPPGHPGPPCLQLLSSRYWVSNAYGGSLRSSVAEMYRNLPDLAIKIKENLVGKLKAIIAHGLEPPLLVGLDSLPLDLLERVFIRSDVKSAVCLAQTCSRTRSVFAWENVWRKLTRREFERYREVSDEQVRERHGSWREAFITEWKSKHRVRRFGSTGGYLYGFGPVDRIIEPANPGFRGHWNLQPNVWPPPLGNDDEDFF